MGKSIAMAIVYMVFSSLFFLKIRTNEECQFANVNRFTIAVVADGSNRWMFNTMLEVSHFLLLISLHGKRVDSVAGFGLSNRKFASSSESSVSKDIY